MHVGICYKRFRTSRNTYRVPFYNFSIEHNHGQRRDVTHPHSHAPHVMASERFSNCESYLYITNIWRGQIFIINLYNFKNLYK